jgi:Putative collagen-binding domain of a collagenase
MQTSNAAEQTLIWVNKSAAAKQSWVVAVDESGGSEDGVKPDINDPLHNWNRQTQLYANIMNGGGGVEYYFGYGWANNDLTCQNFRTRSNMWDQSRYALEFFKNNKIPFWQMSPNRTLLFPVSKDNWCLATKNFSNIVIYLSKGGTSSLNSVSVPVGTTWIVKWFDPLAGGLLQDGSVKSITTTGLTSFPVSLGTAPIKPSQDWLLWLRTI